MKLELTKEEVDLLYDILVEAFKYHCEILENVERIDSFYFRKDLLGEIEREKKYRSEAVDLCAELADRLFKWQEEDSE